jgi:hypothetical protein
LADLDDGARPNALGGALPARLHEGSASGRRSGRASP